MSMSDIQVVVADTDAGRHLHYQLRYEVFCLETGFEEASRFSDKQERDEYDDRSVHFLVRNTNSGEWMATARLIFPGDRPLPVEHRCNLDQDHVCMSDMVELSRLLIAPPFRRRRQGVASKRTAGTDPRPASHSTRPEAAWILGKLIRAIAAYCVEHDIPGAVFFVTPALARILNRMKIQLTVIGEPCQHRGLRYPYASDGKQVFDAVSRIIERERPERESDPYRLFSEWYSPVSPHVGQENLNIRFGT